MRDYFWVDGERCDTVGVHLQGPVTFSAPKPNVESVEVPGRNGALHIYDGSFGNVTGKVDCFALEVETVNEVLNAITRWSLLQRGYRRLEVSGEPEYFRLAAVSVGPENELRMRTLAPFSITFDCQPQKFMKSGEQTITVTASGKKIRNTGFPALPLITVYGSGPGTVTVNDTTVQIKSMTDYLTIDSDTQNAYKGNTPQNSAIYAPDPLVLENGINEISFSGGVDRLVIKPRWWTL